MNRTIVVDGVSFELVRKKIKSVRIAVYASDGHVRVSAPLRLSEDAILRTVNARLPWIRAKQAEFRQRAPEPQVAFVTGETHAFEGTGYLLRVEERAERPAALLAGDGTIRLFVPPGSDREMRGKVLEHWYRAQLQQRAAALVGEWADRIGVQVAEVRVRRMRTRWGSCNIEARRIWLNLELVKKPASCLEYVVVHEMAHLHERRHDKRFTALMDSYLPDWRDRKAELNGRGR